MTKHPGRWLLISLGVAIAATAVAFAVAGTRRQPLFALDGDTEPATPQRQPQPTS